MAGMPNPRPGRPSGPVRGAALDKRHIGKVRFAKVVFRRSDDVDDDVMTKVETSGAHGPSKAKWLLRAGEWCCVDVHLM